MARVGFVGAGQMGMPMVERLAAAGLDPLVHTRRQEVAGRLADGGIRSTGSLRALAEEADIVCVCTFDDRQLREVALGGEGLLEHLAPGSVLVSHTTGSPALISDLAGAAPRGVGVVDAPVSGTADQIRAGQLTVLAGADPGSLQQARPVLATYASTILHVGGVGDAQRIKLVNNLVFTAHLHIAALAAGLSVDLGVEPADLSRALVHCSGTSLPITMLQQVPVDALIQSARPFLAKDVAAVRAVAAGMGLDLGPLGDLAAWVDAPTT
jgi:3-hydroxyisobutyrate dehydrogenase-like beta-hydroxyacid dehydrogenase